MMEGLGGSEAASQARIGWQGKVPHSYIIFSFPFTVLMVHLIKYKHTDIYEVLAWNSN